VAFRPTLTDGLALSSKNFSIDIEFFKESKKVEKIFLKMEKNFP